MRVFGILLALIGTLVGVVALSMDTTVSSELGRIHNIGLMNEQQNLLIFGGIAVIAGILLTLLTKEPSQANPARPATRAFDDPFDEAESEAIRRSEEHINARKRYAISLGITRVENAYRSGDNSFDDLEDAIRHAQTTKNPDESTSNVPIMGVGAIILLLVIVLVILRQPSRNSTVNYAADTQNVIDQANSDIANASAIAVNALDAMQNATALATDAAQNAAR